jgi:hypothetical protein
MITARQLEILRKLSSSADPRLHDEREKPHLAKLLRRLEAERSLVQARTSPRSRRMPVVAYVPKAGDE